MIRGLITCGGGYKGGGIVGLGRREEGSSGGGSEEGMVEDGGIAGRIFGDSGRRKMGRAECLYQGGRGSHGLY